MNRKLISLLLAAVLCLACFSGCQARKPETDSGQASPPASFEKETEPETEKPEPQPTYQAAEIIEPMQAPAIAFNAFDSGLLQYLCQTELGSENFTVSPLSFRAALALAALGAEGETLDQLLTALGYTDRDSMIAWYQTVLEGMDKFDSYFNSSRFESRGEAAYQVVNSVWNNEDLPGEFREEYTAEAEEQFRAEVRSAAADALTDAINNWVKEQTNGLIPSLLSDASDASSILVNALYLKAGWEGSFSKIGTNVFTTAGGSRTDKEFIRSTDYYLYYADETCELVSVTLQGGVRMVFVLGDANNIGEKLAKATRERVEVTIPMFKVETTYDQHELCDYLRSIGCDRMFTDFAEFDPMFTESLLIGDIIQKAKVAIDEEGLEAAAATAILTYGTTGIPQQPPEPKIFRADRPFSFYVINGSEAAELLFWGQIVN